MGGRRYGLHGDYRKIVTVARLHKVAGTALAAISRFAFMRRLFTWLEAVWDRPAVSMAFTVTVLVLLPLLGWLQYRWIDKVSEAQREIMQTSLRTSSEAFSKELNEEITRIYFQVVATRPTTAVVSTRQIQHRH